MKKLKLLSAALCAVAVIAFTGCGKNDAAKGKGDVEAIFAVNAYRVVPTSIDDYLEFGGDVDAASSVSVMPDTAGKISSLNVKLGQRVAKGEILCYVDASKPGMNYAPSPVRAPVAGTVTYFPNVIGTSVGPTSPVAKIASTADLKIETAVAERFISRITMGQKAQLTFTAYPSETFDAHITEISPILDSTSRAMSIKLAVDQKTTKIKIGMYAKIHLVTEHKDNVTVLPYGTVITRNGESFVFKVGKDGDKTKAVLSPVVVGLRVDNNQEIISGIEKDDLVIVKGQTLLSDGSLINVVSVTNEN